jgi:hypothetical protein
VSLVNYCVPLHCSLISSVDTHSASRLSREGYDGQNSDTNQRLSRDDLIFGIDCSVVLECMSLSALAIVSSCLASSNRNEALGERASWIVMLVSATSTLCLAYYLLHSRLVRLSRFARKLLCHKRLDRSKYTAVAQADEDDELLEF